MANDTQTVQRDWTYTTDRLPPEGVEVEVLNGNVETTLVYSGNLWWFPDRNMYVYYVPKMWRSVA